MLKLTKAQQQALYRVFERTQAFAPALTETPTRSYLTFRRGVFPGPGCVMVRFAGMWLGIEPDGHTHS